MWPFTRRRLAYIDRPLEARDAKQCAALHGTAFALGWSTAEFESLIAASNTRGDGSFDGANDQMLAFVLSRLAADEAEILTIATAHPARRSGLASSLLTTHINTVTRAGARKLLLEVAMDNNAALALYRKFGFRQVGERPAYYARPDGGTASARILELRI